MATFSFTLPTGQKFDIKGPDGLTFEQAKAIFDKQASTGSLVGFKPGDVLSAATQASAGLKSAQALLTQAQSGITGALNAGINTVTGTVGQVNAAFAQAGGALNGVLSNIPGINGAGGPALGKLAPSLNQVTGVVNSTIQTVNSTLASTPLTNPINGADFVKTLPALNSIGNMAQSVVTSSLASVKNVVGQTATAISNTNGVGQFGFDVKQLEKVGLVKPGMAALAESAGSTISDVLKSPAAWTGKNNVSNLGDLIASPQLQSTVQQTLMSTGLKELGSLGVPVKNLSSQALSGLSAVAAKSVTGAAALLAGKAIPGDPTGALKAKFDGLMRDGAFAANFAELKIPPAWKEETIPIPAANTVNRETLNAACTRVIGNPKVPALDYGPPPASSLDAINGLLNKFKESNADYLAKIESLSGKVSALENQQNITQDEWNAIRQEFREIGQSSNRITEPLRIEVVELINRLPSTDRKTATAEYKSIEQGEFKAAVAVGSAVLDRINLLKSKISTVESA